MKFSIIIPTCNRSRSIARALQALSQVNYKKSDFEVLIIDNSYLAQEQKKTKNTVSKFSTKMNIKYFFSKEGGPSPARNLGVKKSKNSHLIFLDDDTVFDNNIIKSYQMAWKKFPSAKMIGGRVKPDLKFKKPRFVDKEFEWVYALNDLGSKYLNLKYPQMLFSANMSLRLSLSEKNKKLFNETLGRRYSNLLCVFGEDVELSYRFQLQNKKIIYTPKIEVRNVVDTKRSSPFYYWKRIVNGGVERYLVDQIVSKKYKNFKKYPGFVEIKHRFKLMLKNILLSQSRNTALLENSVYFVSYHALGRLASFFLISQS